MFRRTFLQLPPAFLTARFSSAAQDAPLPMTTLGKTGLRVSRFCLGGAHMSMGGMENGVRIVRRAIELGVNFLDSAHLYNKGLSDEVYGEALQGGLRRQVILMSKAERRDRKGALQQLEETLRRMRTDYLDLWQCHQVTTMEEVDQILAPGGALEAFVQAKKEGKARHIGFTGHADPAVHLRLLAAFDGWETVQHPVNLVDPHYLSFIRNVLPEVRKRGLGLIAMKSNAMGPIAQQGIATVAECLRFTLSHDVDVVVSGVQTVQQLEENVATVKSFQKLTQQEIDAILARTAKGPVGVKVERYKRAPSGASLPRHMDGEVA
jgi:aryl-alcohol dehydrogenase-like predicted oxidoreductase